MLDRRRFLGDSERAELLAACEYKCQGDSCSDRDLTGKKFHFHHIHPYAMGGRTTRFQHLVLCEGCHVEVHRSKSTDLSSEFGGAWPDLREWQRDALGRFVGYDEKKTFVLEAAPGAGKTMFAACAARYVIDHHPEINHVICIAPWVPILSSMKRTFGRMQLELRDKFHYDKKRGRLQAMPDVDVTLDTYAGFCNPVTVDVLEHWHERFDFRFMLILDEVHHTNIVSGTWGPYAERIAAMASKLVIMSGTYFRSDRKQISFLNYGNDKPATDYTIDYVECVEKRYVRQVAFRYHDPTLEILSRNSSSTRLFQLSKLQGSQKRFSKAKQEVLNPNGDHVGEMINDAWRELQVMRRKWSDAACLVVCAASTSGEERMIHAVQSRITELTGQTVEAVTSDDAASRGRIEAFARSESPFLCAIRMVSEGVDIPRIRMILFLSYTDSEMLFRQIVGRCIRYIPGREDDTAALVVMPKFPVMAEFADRFESEAEQGLTRRELVAVDGDRVEGEGASNVCAQCYSHPCHCFVVLDSFTEMGGGQIAASLVPEKFIERAKIIRESSTAHQHANIVQLADALQRNEQITVAGIEPRMEDMRQTAMRNLDRKVGMLARYKYENDFRLAWAWEVTDRTGVSRPEIESTWRLSQIQELVQQLKNSLTEAICNA
jgi:superfamily II DNA or RNA helicase